MVAASIWEELLRCFSTVPPQHWISSTMILLLGKTLGVTKKNFPSNSLLLFRVCNVCSMSHLYSKLKSLGCKVYLFSGRNWLASWESLSHWSDTKWTSLAIAKKSLLVRASWGITRCVKSWWSLAKHPPSSLEESNMLVLVLLSLSEWLLV